MVLFVCFQTDSEDKVGSKGKHILTHLYKAVITTDICSCTPALA